MPWYCRNYLVKVTCVGLALNGRLVRRFNFFPVQLFPVNRLEERLLANLKSVIGATSQSTSSHNKVMQICIKDNKPLSRILEQKTSE